MWSRPQKIKQAHHTSVSSDCVILLHCERTPCSATENTELSWWHLRLSSRQPTVPPVDDKVGIVKTIGFLWIHVPLTHWVRVTHICVSKLTIIRWITCLSPAWSASSHYLNQWNIVNWTLRNKLQWNLYLNSYILFKKMQLEMSSTEWKCPYVTSKEGSGHMLQILKKYSKTYSTHHCHPKQWLVIHSSHLMMIIRWSTDILRAIFREMGKAENTQYKR